jgi:predicted lipoprotein with Yx(FWY)xxD motif
MTTLRRTCLVVGLALAVSIFLAGCGNAQATNTGNTSNMGTMYQTASTATVKATPTSQATMPGYGYGNGTTPTASSTTNGNDGGNMSAFIHTATVTLNGKMVHVLTTNKGFMLYYYTKDNMLASNCTGSCAQSWPPLLAPQGMMSVNSSLPLPKMLSVHKTANGNQVFYDGHALYTYTGDMQPGQFTGRGSGNAWYLVGFTL